MGVVHRKAHFGICSMRGEFLYKMRDLFCESSGTPYYCPSQVSQPKQEHRAKVHFLQPLELGRKKDAEQHPDLGFM